MVVGWSVLLASVGQIYTVNSNRNCKSKTTQEKRPQTNMKQKRKKKRKQNEEPNQKLGASLSLSRLHFIALIDLTRFDSDIAFSSSFLSTVAVQEGMHTNLKVKKEVKKGKYHPKHKQNKNQMQLTKSRPSHEAEQ